MDTQRWQLLQYRNIARHASAKQVRKFVKALDVRLLRQIIEIYAESIISQSPKQYEALSASKTLKHWKQRKQNDDQFKLSADDVTILKSLKQLCINKRASMYQSQSKLLLSVPMEILSYSFSFLSFSELSATQRVCLCFMNSSRKYSNLSHHHLDINPRFIRNVVSNQVNLDLLTHFKSIRITGESKKVTMFTFVLQRIITRSQSSLQSLTMDYRFCYPRVGLIAEVVLELILNSAPTFPALHTIYWMRNEHETCPRRSRSNSTWRFRIAAFKYGSLIKVIRQRIPHLRHLQIKTESYDMEGAIESLVDCPTLNSIHLANSALLSTSVIPHILFKMDHLSSLHICAEEVALHPEIANACIKNDVLDGNADVILSNHKISVINHGIRILNLRLAHSEAHGQSATFITNILIYFFVHCVNITDLTLDLSSFKSFMCRNIKWQLLLDLLMEQKTRYGAPDAQSLSKLTIVATQDVSTSIINGLHKTLSVHSKLKYLQQIRVKLPNRKVSPQLNRWVRTTIDTVSAFESLTAFSIQMPSMYKDLSVHWNCNAPKPISCSGLYHHLTELKLEHKDLFGCDVIPVALKNIPTLSHLSISTNIPEETKRFCDGFKNEFVAPHQWEYNNAKDIMNECQPSFHHPALQTLKLCLVFEAGNFWARYRYVEHYTMKVINENVAHILSYFYLTCPHITDVSMDWRGLRFRNDDEISIPWALSFDLLNANKIKHTAKPLAKLCVNGPQYMLLNAVNGLTLSSNRSYDLYIKYLTHMELIQGSRTSVIKSGINETVMGFWKMFKENDCELKSLRITIKHDTFEDYCEYILMLLQNVPKSLEHLYLSGLYVPLGARDDTMNCWFPRWPNPYCKRRNTYDDTSWNIVKCLVNISTNNDLNIKNIDFDGLSIHRKAMEYLQFFFGFENKLVHNDSCYKITFKS